MRKILSTFFAGEKLFYGLLILTPFLFSNAFNEAFEFPKLYFVYFAGSLLILLTVLGRLWGSGDRTKADGTNQSPTSPNDRQCDISAYPHHGFVRLHGGYTLLVGLFVLSFILSTIFSNHLYTSLWGYFSRFNGGLVSVLIFFGLYWTVLQLKPKTQSVLKAVALTMLPISLYSIMQHLGLAGTWTTDTTTRAFSTFGQPNWYATYCTMVLPIVLYFALNSNDLTHSPSTLNKASLQHSGWYFLFALGFTGFWFAYSVSGLIGLLISCAFVLILNKRATLKNWRGLAILLLVCCATALSNPGIFKQRLNDVLKEVPINHSQSTTQKSIKTDRTNSPTENLSEDSSPTNQTDPNPQTKPIEYNLSDSGFIRKGIWEGTVKLWLASPKNFLIGTGPETFPYDFQFFRPASLNYSSEWNFILNKPHNYYLELLAQNGLLGLLIYLAIIIKVLLAKHPVLTPALIGLFVTNIFGWPTVYTALLFWTFLALLTLKTNPTKLKLQPTIRYKTLLTMLAIFVYFYATILFGRQILADMFSKASDGYFEAGESKKSLDYSTKSLELNPNEPYYYRQRAKTYMLTLVGQPRDQVDRIKALAYEDVTTATSLNPKNLATLRGNISLYYFLALENLVDATNNSDQDAREASAITPTDPHYLILADDYYTKLSQDYPNDVGIQTQVAKYQKLLGLEDEYKETLQKVKILRPELIDWYLN